MLQLPNDFISKSFVPRSKTQNVSRNSIQPFRFLNSMKQFSSQQFFTFCSYLNGITSVHSQANNILLNIRAKLVTVKLVIIAETAVPISTHLLLFLSIKPINMPLCTSTGPYATSVDDWVGLKKQCKMRYSSCSYNFCN